MDLGPEGVVEADIQFALLFERAGVAAEDENAAGVGARRLIVERQVRFKHVADGLEWTDLRVKEAVGGLRQGEAGREAVAVQTAGIAVAQVLVAPVFRERGVDIEPGERAVLRAEAQADIGVGAVGGVGARAAGGVAESGVAVVEDAAIPGLLLGLALFLYAAPKGFATFA